MRRTKEDAEITRQHLLKAGLKVFSEKGYAASRLSDIAEVAGVTRGAIYWHFKNKKELFIALFKENVNPVFAVMAKVLGEDLEPLQKLRKLVSKTLDQIEKNTEFRANQALEFENRKTQQEIPELFEYMKNHAEEFSISIKNVILSGQERGDIRRDIEADAIICTFLTLFRGYGFFMTHEAILSIFKTDQSEQIVEIFIKGIKA